MRTPLNKTSRLHRIVARRAPATPRAIFLGIGIFHLRVSLPSLTLPFVTLSSFLGSYWRRFALFIASSRSLRGGTHVCVACRYALFRAHRDGRSLAHGISISRAPRAISFARFAALLAHGSLFFSCAPCSPPYLFSWFARRAGGRHRGGSAANIITPTTFRARAAARRAPAQRITALLRARARARHQRGACAHATNARRVHIFRAARCHCCARLAAPPRSLVFARAAPARARIARAITPPGFVALLSRRHRAALPLTRLTTSLCWDGPAPPYIAMCARHSCRHIAHRFAYASRIFARSAHRLYHRAPRISRAFRIGAVLPRARALPASRARVSPPAHAPYGSRALLAPLLRAPRSVRAIYGSAALSPFAYAMLWRGGSNTRAPRASQLQRLDRRQHAAHNKRISRARMLL